MTRNPRKLKFTLGEETTFYDAARVAFIALSVVAIVGFGIGFIVLCFKY